MIIFVPNELKYIKDELIKREYNIVSTNDIPCDIVICDLKNGGLLDVNVENNLKVQGTLIIDIGSKSIDEIEYIINNRIYSPFF
ncbi:YkuS family protein [Haloimpatiens sp. FM7330]|uniref:YkuS family protein n=1 Tax=Haloimpatiens sp. FM7330 TaxID=3298610 RepID=UPI0036288E12